ncbi:MAG: hypothetical protein ACXVDD_12440 [Polyangia bacterium]
MRLACALLVLFCAGCCDPGPEQTTPVGRDLSASPSGADLALPPECPRAFQSPAYCFAGALGTASSCGPCTTVGESCDYFEASLVCACDHQWRCSYAGGSSGGCQTPDGGVVCN